VDYAKKKNYVVVLWSIAPKDFLQPPASAIAHRVLSQAKPGAIVLMHDGGGNRQETIKALSVIIPKLKQQGYRFPTVPQNASCTKTANGRSQIPINRHLIKIHSPCISSASICVDQNLSAVKNPNYAKLINNHKNFYP